MGIFAAISDIASQPDINEEKGWFSTLMDTRNLFWGSLGDIRQDDTTAEVVLSNLMLQGMTMWTKIKIKNKSPLIHAP